VTVTIVPISVIYILTNLSKSEKATGTNAQLLYPKRKGLPL